MEQYQLRLFGPCAGKSGSRAPTGDFDFSAPDNLEAIEHAKAAFSAALSCCDYAVLRQRDVGVIWEDHAGAALIGVGP
jgi:hypothetical protein